MRILVFGDSITQGFHDELSGGWCNRLVSLVIQREVENGKYNKSVINLGISGDTSLDLLRRIKNEVEARVGKYPTDTFDVALIAIGVNDTQYDMETKLPKFSVAETKVNLESILSICNELKLKVIFIGPAPVFEPRIQPMAWKPSHGYGNDLIKERTNVIIQLAETHQCLFIDMENVYQGSEDEMLPDGIHPNAKGHEMIFEYIRTYLESVSIL